MASDKTKQIVAKDFLAFAESALAPLQRTQLIVPDFQDPRGYQRPDGLFESFDAAMLLGLPLLITGEPGTGKTQAAYWLSQTLGENDREVEDKDKAPALLQTDVKSTTGGRDLLYRFDEVARFRDSAAGGTPRPLIDYLEFEALGEAIVRAAGGTAALKVLGSKSPEEVCLRAFGRTDGAMVAADLLPGDPSFKTAEPTCRVVLIDELDKAPRDTPNDLLAEVENMAFSIPELGLRIDAAAGAADPRLRQRPIVVITSNSERDLPEPFLRRCAFFHIDFPSEAQLKQIVAERIRQGFGTPDKPSHLAESTTSLLTELRRADLAKKPGTAEYLAWCAWLAGSAVGLKANTRWQDLVDPEQGRRLIKSLGCLVKTKDDFGKAKAILIKRLSAMQLA